MRAMRIGRRTVAGILLLQAIVQGVASEPATVVVQPQTQSVLPGCSATFVAGVTGTAPVHLQWHRNDQPLPGETNDILTVREVAIADNGARFRLTATNAFGGDATVEVVLVVLPDTSRPKLLEAGCDASRWRVFARFGGGPCGGPRLDRGSAQTANHYTLRTAQGSSFGVYSATLDSSGTLVTLVTDYLTQDTTYTLSVSNITDLTGHFVDPTATAGFQARWPVPNSVLVERFRAANPACGSCPIFPCGTNLLSREFRSFFDTQPAPLLVASREPCTRISSYFIPPISGRWTFFLRSSSTARLYVGPLGGNPDGVREAIYATGCCQPFYANPSAPMELQANHPVYLEGHIRESISSGYLQVAARWEGDPSPLDQLTELPPEYLRPIDPAATGLITILQQPRDGYSTYGSPVTFAVSAIANSVNPLVPFPVLHYQWQRSEGYFSSVWEDVAGATNAAYSTPQVDNCGSQFPARYRCQLFAAGAQVATRAASLFVIIVDFFPEITSAVGGPTLDTVTINYWQPVSANSAGDLFNYEISDLSIESVEVLSQTTVRLRTDRQIPNRIYEVKVSNVHGLGSGECEGPVIFPGTQVRFQAWRPLRGATLREIYFSIPGFQVLEMRNNPKFPDRPDRVDFVRELDAGTQSAGFNLADNYGLRLTGFIEAPVTQAYDFYLTADDSGEFWLSANEDRANLRLICSGYEPMPWRQWTGLGGNPSPAQPPNSWSRALFPNGVQLNAGQWYAFEALLKEGFGSDHLSVAWTPHDEPVPLNGSPAISGPVLMGYGRGIEIEPSGGFLKLSWTLGGTLQSAPALDGPWTAVPNVSSNTNSVRTPHPVVPSFYRVAYPNP